jgi:hypothetical protein
MVMTQTIATNESNDIYIDLGGRLNLVSGENAVLNACATASKLQLGEAIFQINKGIPNFQAVWVGVPNIPIFEKYLRDTLESVDGVNKVISLTAQSNSGILSYSATIESKYGRVFLNG